MLTLPDIAVIILGVLFPTQLYMDYLLDDYVIIFFKEMIFMIFIFISNLKK